MPSKAKFGFGSSLDVDKAIQEGKINARDILFLDENTDKPKIGWVSKSGKPIILTNEKADLSEIEADVEAIELELTTKASTEELQAVDAKIASKADTSEVDAKIKTATTDSITSAKEYTDGKIEAAINEHMVKKYEITSIPEGTLVDYREKEIRVLCPANTQWVKQNVGPTGNANMYYMGFKAYAPNGAVSFKEDDQATIADQTMYYFEDNDFAGIDKYGRKYSIVWLALATYDEASNTWSYFGAKSSAEKYIGWYYSVEWYDANGVMIASDCIRVNLSNENCHTSVEPYYVTKMMTEVESIIEEKVKEVETSYEVVEF